MANLTIERLTSIEEGNPGYVVGSAATILRVMREPPHLSSSDVDELDAAIAAERLTVQIPDIFSN